MRYGTSVVVVVSSLIVGLTVAVVAQGEGGGRTPTTITTVKVPRAQVKTIRTEVPVEKAVRQETPAFRGEGFFLQRCSTCHVGEWRKAGQVKAYAPVLTGVLKDASRETTVRNYIRNGSANMPGFSNTFTTAQFDDLIAYLKTL